MEKKKAGCEKQGKATSQGLRNWAFSTLQLNTAPVPAFVTPLNSGKEHSKHHLSQITNTADHYFISCKAEAWGLGWVLVLRWGGGGGYVCFVWFPHLPQLKTLPAFYSQESQHSLRLKPMQPSLFPGFINYGIPSQSYKFHLVKRIHCTDKH